MTQLRKTHRIWLAAFLLLAVLGLLFYFIDPQEVWHELRGADWRWLLAGWIFLLLGIGMISVRWRYLLHQSPSYSQVIKSDGMSFLTTSLSPVPAPALRVLTISQISQVTISQSTTGMLIERVIEQILRVACLLLALLFFSRSLISPLALSANVVGIILILLLVFWLLRSPSRASDLLSNWVGRIPKLDESRARGFINSLVHGFIMAGSPGRFITAFLISLAMWVSFLGFQIMILLALGQELSFLKLVGLALATLAVVPPSAPAMPGLYHGIVIASLGILGILDASTITTYAILSHILQLSIWLPLGVWGFLRTDLRLQELLVTGKKFHTSTPSRNTPEYQPSQKQQRNSIDEHSPAI